jgi:hypothetical protein
MSGGFMVAMATCYGCKRVFEFDPDTVTTILIDPATGLPPDVDADGNRRPAPTCPDEACRRDVVCPDCVKRANEDPRRAELGLPPIP